MHFSKMSVSWYSNDTPANVRESELQSFESGQTKVLVATQILARGVALKGVNLVINFNVPAATPTTVDRSIFIQQISRCTQLDAKGFAITLTDPNSPAIDTELSLYGIRSIKI